LEVATAVVAAGVITALTGSCQLHLRSSLRLLSSSALRRPASCSTDTVHSASSLDDDELARNTFEFNRVRWVCCWLHLPLALGGIVAGYGTVHTIRYDTVRYSTVWWQYQHNTVTIRTYYTCNLCPKSSHMCACMIPNVNKSQLHAQYHDMHMTWYAWAHGATTPMHDHCSWHPAHAQIVLVCAF
jgi:hypothetical protein